MDITFIFSAFMRNLLTSFISVSLLLTLTNSAIAAEPRSSYFSGKYMGFGAGGTQLFSNTNEGLVISVNLAPSESSPQYLTIMPQTRGKSTDINVEGQVILGYGEKRSEKNYLGFEGRVGWNNIGVPDDYRVMAMTGPFVPTLFNATSTVKTTAVTVAALLRPGYLVNPKTMVYGLFGVKAARFKNIAYGSYTQAFGDENNVMVTGNINSKDYFAKLGEAVGLGIESYINDRATIALDYHFTHYGKHTFSANTPLGGGADGTLTMYTQDRLYSNTILLRINYKF